MDRYLEFLAPTLNFQPGDIAKVPVPQNFTDAEVETWRCVEIARRDWNSMEQAFEFSRSPLLGRNGSLSKAVSAKIAEGQGEADELQALESKNNRLIAESFDLGDVVPTEVPIDRVTLFGNPAHVYGLSVAPTDRTLRAIGDSVQDLVSYAVGCMLGRYSLDEPGLILANHGDTLADYLAKVPEPSFMPDADNVLPIVDGDWFEDDIVARFRQFLRVAFGDEHFEENLRFVTDALGVKDLRDYFVKSFYKDHVQRYKKRPIYWLFSSPKGSFNALIYMHRYTPSTVSTVLNEYLREFKVKIEASRQHHEHLATSADTARQQGTARKEADRLRKVLLELDAYEHDVLYPLATQQIDIDLDDGVKTNYPKLGTALKTIPGLDTND